jgi:uncharacterized protein
MAPLPLPKFAPFRVASARRFASWLSAGLLWLALAYGALAAPPALTGRVVDQANILSPGAREQIARKSEDLEQKSGIQLVVATVASLDGRDIESYSIDLARSWALGQKDRDNGVLLLVAPNERKVRIEVGRRLEGTLTDALSKVIITNAIAPRFKQGDYDGGVSRAVDDIIAVLTVDAQEWQQKPDLRVEPEPDVMAQLLPFVVFAVFLLIVFMMMRHRGSARRGGNVIFMPPIGGGWGGGGGFGGGGGGGFFGGGGSFGGGGASGDW